METAYWIVAALLSALYLLAGGKKLLQSREQLLPMMEWVEGVPMARVRAIGAIELAGVIGLVVPPLVDVLPVLTLLAAIGFVVLQLFATRVHLARGEGLGDIGINLVSIALAVAASGLATTWL